MRKTHDSLLMTNEAFTGWRIAIKAQYFYVHVYTFFSRPSHSLGPHSSGTSASSPRSFETAGGPGNIESLFDLFFNVFLMINPRTPKQFASSFKLYVFWNFYKRIHWKHALLRRKKAGQTLRVWLGPTAVLKERTVIWYLGKLYTVIILLFCTFCALLVLEWRKRGKYMISSKMPLNF